MWTMARALAVHGTLGIRKTNKMPYNWQKQLILIRGLPGSGKTTLASKIIESMSELVSDKDSISPGEFLVEADHYRMVNGEYRHDDAQNSLAHDWCLSEAFRRLQREQQPFVVVANVFTLRSYVFLYVETARKLEVKVSILESDQAHLEPSELANRTIGNGHHVPEEVIERMLLQWEPISQEEVNILTGQPD